MIEERNKDYIIKDAVISYENLRVNLSTWGYVYFKPIQLRGIRIEGTIVSKRTRTWLIADEKQINYKRIVSFILRKHKEIIPTLLGIDKKFDIVLAQKLKA